MIFHCFSGFWVFSVLESCVGRPSADGNLSKVFIVHVRLCAVHILSTNSLIVVKLWYTHCLFKCPFAFSYCYTTKHHITGCKYCNSSPNPKRFQRSCSFWREKAELLPPLVSPSVLAEALSMSWVFHVPSVRRKIASYLSARILESVTSSYEWAEYSFLQLLWVSNTNPEMSVHDELS